MSGLQPIALAGEPVVLDAARALYWPRMRTLLVADVHFGKAQLFRRAGIPIPRGTTSGDLARLDALIARHEPARLLVLGDLVHGAGLVDDAWVTEVRKWRARHATRAIEVVAGNHDRHFDARDAGFALAGAVVHEGPFALAHAPRPIADRYVLSGHLHPGVELREAGMRGRLPVFWFGAHVGVLPAFGRMTGLAMITPARDDTLIAIAGDGLVPLPARAFA